MGIQVNELSQREQTPIQKQHPDREIKHFAHPGGPLPTLPPTMVAPFLIYNPID